MIRSQQMEVTWQNYIYAVFHNDDSTPTKRRRKVALALGVFKGVIPPDKIPTLTPKLAQLYHDLALRTLHRDVRALRLQGLLLSGIGGVSANLDLVKAFLPTTGAALADETSQERAS